MVELNLRRGESTRIYHRAKSCELEKLDTRLSNKYTIEQFEGEVILASSIFPFCRVILSGSI
jgi:hypothetical protein